MHNIPVYPLEESIVNTRDPPTLIPTKSGVRVAPDLLMKNVGSYVPDKLFALWSINANVAVYDPGEPDPELEV